MTNEQDKSSITGRGSSMPSGTPTRSEIDAFLADIGARTTAATGTRGRLIFALDATASRKGTWDLACQLQAEMFREVANAGGLDMQLVYYRGSVGECRASKWFSQSEPLTKVMSQIRCQSGTTQIKKVLVHAQKETKLLRVSALIFVGDAIDGDSLDILAHEASELGRLGVPAFMFQEEQEHDAEHAFREVARLTHGAYCRFDPGSARQLAQLLKAVAVFAVGGLTALAARRDAGDVGSVKLLSQMR